MRIAEAPIFPVIVIEDADIGLVRVLAGGAGSEKILLAVSLEIGWCLTGERRKKMIIMDAIFLGDLSVGVREGCANHLKMRPLVPDIGLFVASSTCRQKSPQNISQQAKERGKKRPVFF